MTRTTQLEEDWRALKQVSSDSNDDGGVAGGVGGFTSGFGGGGEGEGGDEGGEGEYPYIDGFNTSDELIRGMAARGLERAGGDGLEWGTTWAGAAVGLVPAATASEPQSARTIVEDVMVEAVDALSRASRRLVPHAD